jgi:hypothetical protein
MVTTQTTTQAQRWRWSLWAVRSHGHPAGAFSGGRVRTVGAAEQLDRQTALIFLSSRGLRSFYTDL